MTTSELESCATCPLRSATSAFTPDTLVPGAPVLVLADRAGDPPPPDRLLGLAKLRRGTNVSFGAALRCEAARKVRSGKRLEKALAACRAHDQLDDVRLVVCVGAVAWSALGFTDFSVSRGYARAVGA